MTTPRKWAARCVRATALVAPLLAYAATAEAQHVNPELWFPNNTVRATCVAGPTLYIGGDFQYVGPYTGHGVPLDVASGTAVAGFPKVRGARITTVVADGSGGWFVGGTFDSVGGLPRHNLAHVLSNLTVASWDPTPNGSINTLAVNGSTVYVCGGFTSIGGQSRNLIAALDAVSGAATAWNPDASGGEVVSLAVSGSSVYAGGQFTNIGGQPRMRIAALHRTTGLATSWQANADSSVNVLVANGATIYAGGRFTHVGGQARNFLAALDTVTGSATGWNPGADDRVTTLAVNGSTVYAGGRFTHIGATPRRYLAAIDAALGTATAWDPDPNGEVLSLGVGGSIVYVGGNFATIGGQARNNLAAISAATGLATGWDPNTGNFVDALAVDGTRVYAGGIFSSLGGVSRSRLAAIDLATGAATSWNPGANATVRALAASGSTVYAGGDFTQIGGQNRNYLGALDAVSGAARAWDPSPIGPLYALAVGRSVVYAAGNFSQIGGQNRNWVAALDSASGLATAWNPNPNSEVDALVVSGARIYAAGYFSGIGGETRNRIAALDTTTGAATAWDPNANANVTTLAVSGSTIYAGGAFTAIDGQLRGHVAALDATSAHALAWNPNADLDVRALAVSGSTVYAGGDFNTIGGQTLSRLAALRAPTGAAAPWSSTADGHVFALAVHDSSVYAGGDFTGVGGLPQAYLAMISTVPPTLASIEPASGGNAGAVTATVYGNDLASGATVRLTRSGESDIAGSGVTVADDGTSLDATFDLTGAEAGAWNVVFTNPNAQSASLTNGFEVTVIDAAQLRVSVIGPPQIRANRRYPYDVVIENPGNVDAIGVPLWISGVPSDALIEPDFALATPPQSGGEPPWSSVPLFFSSPGGRYLPLVIPRVPPGTTVRRIFLTVPTTPVFELRAAVTPPWRDGNVFRGCLVNGGISNPVCMGAQLTAINATLDASLTIQALSGIGAWAKIAWQCEGAATLPAALAKAEQVLDFMVGPVESPATALAACSDVLPPRWRDSLTVTIVGAIDPNEKLGTGDTISVHQAIPYSIRFENSHTATAPAQDVTITDPLNVTWLEPATVSLGDITFGSVRIIPPPGLSSFSTTVDLRPGRNLLVQVNVGLDPISHTLGWSFVSIDPATGQPPTDPLAGFLPPNVTPPQGEGSVLFTVSPKPSLPGGTIIHNTATINFDGTPTITNDWPNHVDNTPPASHVLPLAVHSDLPSIPVSWTADGSPPDLRDYTICVSEDGAPFRVWRQNVATTGDTLMPPGDHHFHSYSFYSQSRDVAGNVETAPIGADATTQSRLAVEGAGSLELALEGGRPNPVVGALVVWFTLPTREPATLDLIDVAGRRMVRRDVGVLGPGAHHVSLDATPIPPGLYFIRLAQGNRVMNARVAIVR